MKPATTCRKLAAQCEPKSQAQSNITMPKASDADRRGRRKGGYVRCSEAAEGNELETNILR